MPLDMMPSILALIMLGSRTLVTLSMITRLYGQRLVENLELSNLIAVRYSGSMTSWPPLPNPAGVQTFTRSLNDVSSEPMTGKWTGAPESVGLSQRMVTGGELESPGDASILIGIDPPQVNVDELDCMKCPSSLDRLSMMAFACVQPLEQKMRGARLKCAHMLYLSNTLFFLRSQ